MDKNCVITASHSKNLGKFERNGDQYWDIFKLLTFINILMYLYIFFVNIFI